jgi:hypothetical protein
MRERNPQKGRIRVKKYSSSKLEVYHAGIKGQGMWMRVGGVDTKEMQLRAMVVARRGETGA